MHSIDLSLALSARLNEVFYVGEVSPLPFIDVTKLYLCSSLRHCFINSLFCICRSVFCVMCSLCSLTSKNLWYLVFCPDGVLCTYTSVPPGFPLCLSQLLPVRSRSPPAAWDSQWGFPPPPVLSLSSSCGQCVVSALSEQPLARVYRPVPLRGSCHPLVGWSPQAQVLR